MKKAVTILFFILYLAGNLYAETPERIVSLAPSITEILYALGLEENLAAVTNFCDHPPEAVNKPRIGGMSNPSLEAIVRARPDMVVITTDGNPEGIDERLNKLGLNVYVFRATRVSDLPDAIREMGVALGVKDRAVVLADSIESSMRQYKVSGGATVERKGKAIFIIWPEPLVVAGKNTAVDDVLGLLGWENIAAKAGSRYPKFSIEEIVHERPDVIFIGKMRDNTHELSKLILDKLNMLEAVKKGRVYFTSDALYRLGPRIVNGLDEISVYLQEAIK
ncbi:MAG: ABC transporter substrate-binding protein [Nitrospirota bacterium]|nr:MAG: ABC transporter substrate-binding protein [Nitrospirota bacterium]